MSGSSHHTNKLLADLIVAFLKIPHDGSNAYFLARTSLLSYYGEHCSRVLTENIVKTQDHAWLLDNRPQISDDDERRRREDEDEKD